MMYHSFDWKKILGDALNLNAVDLHHLNHPDQTLSLIQTWRWEGKDELALLSLLLLGMKSFFLSPHSLSKCHLIILLIF